MSTTHPLFIVSCLNISTGQPAVQRTQYPGFPVSSPVIACLQEGPYEVPSPNVVGLRPQLQHAAYSDCMNPQIQPAAV